MRGSSCNVIAFESRTGWMTVWGNNATISINICGGVPLKNPNPSVRAILAKYSIQLMPFFVYFCKHAS